MTHAEYALPTGKTFADEFHVFTLDWTPQGIKTYVDGNPLLDVPFDDMFKKGEFPPWVENLWATSNAAPFDEEFYLVCIPLSFLFFFWARHFIQCCRSCSQSKI
jgi:hypothetical protein